MTSFGSGAGADCMSILVTDELLNRRDLALKTQDYIARRKEIDYATYARMRGKITMK
jgi:hydroxymethylglutaryl-CoA synthase